jgi:hypothetical protein
MDHPDDLTWRKSSYSGSSGGNCIEVAATCRAPAREEPSLPRRYDTRAGRLRLSRRRGCGAAFAWAA